MATLHNSFVPTSLQNTSTKAGQKFYQGQSLHTGTGTKQMYKDTSDRVNMEDL